MSSLFGRKPEVATEPVRKGHGKSSDRKEATVDQSKSHETLDDKKPDVAATGEKTQSAGKKKFFDF